ncbi:MAG: T9SS type A sorting domain-containing protein [Saprospiraceae bacterium]|nr:T9SS type A sorting domain-containing protein [Saprospiraceae bacterium]
MNKLNIFLILIMLLCFGVFAGAQTIHPGDADDNGEVNQYDLLYIGYAYGTVGPMRLENDTEFSPQFIPLLWPGNFPNGLNYAYADANGNGIVDFSDILTVGANYGHTHGDLRPLDFVAGTAGLDPALMFDESLLSEPVSVGSVIQLPILLGAPGLPATDVNGIAFSLHCNHPELIRSISLDMSDSWLGSDSNAFHFVNFSTDPLQIEADAALTRFGATGVSGSGSIGVLSIVIEDNLLGFIPIGDSLGLTLTIDSTIMMSSAFGAIPVFTTPLELMVYHPNALPSPALPSPSPELHVFPNPVKAEIHITCTEKIEYLTLSNQLGQMVPFERQLDSERQLRLNVEALPAGTYWLRVQTPRGTAVEQILKE